MATVLGISEAMQNAFPTLRYQDAPAAIGWLKQAFGAEELAVHKGDDGLVHHAELSFAPDAIVMFGSAERGDDSDQLDIPVGGTSIYVVIDDPDAHFKRAEGAGAEIVRGLQNEDYGSRGYTAKDPEGNLWSFGTYRPEGG
jgi:uncharacterized glyoxalase superfamily protein PhnB